MVDIFHKDRSQLQPILQEDRQAVFLFVFYQTLD